MTWRGLAVGLVAGLIATAVGVVLEHFFGFPPYLTGFWSAVAAIEAYCRYG